MSVPIAEGLPWLRAATALSADGSAQDAVDGLDVSSIVDRTRVLVTDKPANSLYEYDRSSAATADGLNVVAPLRGSGRFVALALLGASAYLTQAAWYVDSASGSDTNDGATLGTALKSLGELARRWAGRIFAPSVTQVDVQLYGSFPLDTLVIPVTAVSPLVVTYTGRKTQVGQGTVTAYQAWDSATDKRAQLTDGTQNFAPHLRRRVRLTTGAGAGALTWIGSTSGATVANVGRFRTTAYPTGLEKDPAPGDAYVIEVLTTSILEFKNFAVGPVRVELYDLDISTKAAFPAAGGIMRCEAHMPDLYTRVLGCSVGCVSGTDPGFWGSFQLVSCSFYGPPGEGLGIYFYEGVYNVKSLCAFTSVHCYRNVVVTSTAGMHDGNGTDYVGVNVQEGSIWRVLTGTFDAYFGCLGGVSGYGFLLRCSNGSQIIFSTSYFWGAAGNGTDVALQVENGNGFYYSPTQKPKATGAVPGNDVSLAGGAAIAWAAVPAVAVPPNNAVVAEKA